MAKIGDVCASKIDTLNAAYNGKIDYIDISAVDNDKKKITNTETLQIKEAPSRARQLVECDDIIVSLVRPNLNAVAVVENSSENLQVASTGYCVLRCNQAVYSRYLFYFCQSETFINRMTAQATGASYPAVSNSIVKNCEIPLPERNKQKEIADILDKVTGLISLRKQQLAKLDELVKARFVEMFGDFKNNSKNWPIVKFDELAKIDGNMTTDYEKYADYPHIGIDSIEKETGELKGYRTVKEDGVVSGKYIFTPQHIIYSKIRPNLNKVALPDFEGLCSADAYPILPNPKNCNRIFLALTMRSDYFLDYILQFSARTNLPKVNRKEIAGFSMPLPPLSLQNDFATFVERVSQQKQTIQQSLDKLELMKKALMQEYFG
ncbi:MAG: restriction endonuclease subunit S [Dialister invisus]|jgi:restriction endonuclease, S subunit|nr:restriction endonuclease subunit S [Dialister invisus]